MYLKELTIAAALSTGFPIVKASNAEIEECASFAGDWEGTCVMEEKGTTTSFPPTTVQIQQSGCYEVMEGGNVFIPGGQSTFTKIIPANAITQGSTPFSTSEITIASWNSDKTVLSFSRSISVAILNQSASNSAFNGFYALRKGKLIRQGEQIATDGSGSVASKLTCTFERRS